MAQSIHRGIFTALEAQAPSAGGFNRSLADVALDKTKMLFAAQTGLLWFVVVAALTWFSMIVFDDAPGTAAGAIFVLGWLWTEAVAGLLIGGVGRLVTLDLEGSPSRSTAPAWTFVRQRWPGLTLGVWAVATAFGLAVGTGAAIVAWLSSTSTVGPVLGGLLVVPVFFGVLLAAVFYLAIWMLPCVMSVEGSGLSHAVRVLARMAREAPVAMTGMAADAINHLKGMAGAAFWSGLVTLAGLLVSNVICGGSLEGWMGSSGSAVEWGLSFRLLSNALVVFGWVAFLMVYFAAGVTAAYYRVRR